MYSRQWIYGECGSIIGVLVLIITVGSFPYDSVSILEVSRLLPGPGVEDVYVRWSAAL